MDDLVKVTVNLNRNDYNRLSVLHPGTPRAVVIRMVIQAYITAIETEGQMILDNIKKQP